jgi:hypothetical protein
LIQLGNGQPLDPATSTTNGGLGERNIPYGCSALVQNDGQGEEMNMAPEYDKVSIDIADDYLALEEFFAIVDPKFGF